MGELALVKRLGRGVWLHTAGLQKDHRSPLAKELECDCNAGGAGADDAEVRPQLRPIFYLPGIDDHGRPRGAGMRAPYPQKRRITRSTQ